MRTYSVKQLSEISGYIPYTIRRLCREKKIPGAFKDWWIIKGLYRVQVWHFDADKIDRIGFKKPKFSKIDRGKKCSMSILFHSNELPKLKERMAKEGFKYFSHYMKSILLKHWRDNDQKDAERFPDSRV